jgi:hypothetical protein
MKSKSTSAKREAWPIRRVRAGRGPTTVKRSASLGMTWFHVIELPAMPWTSDAADQHRLEP